MPLYVYGCPNCKSEAEVIQKVGANEPACLECGFDMLKKPTSIAFVYMKGHPSFRKRYLGTAPYTGRIFPSEVKGGPGSKLPVAKIEGEKWIESIE